MHLYRIFVQKHQKVAVWKAVCDMGDNIKMDEICGSDGVEY